MPSVGYATLQIIPSVRGIGKDIERQLTGPAGAAGESAGEAAGGGLRDKLKLGAAAAGVAAGALLVKGLTDAMEQANISSTLQAQLGATGKDAARYGKVAGELYSSGVSGSFQDAADAIKQVVQSGLAPPDATNAQLQKIATKASDVASIFGQDLGGVTNAVSQLMRTGLAKNSTEAFDLVTKGFQSGADKAGDFLDTLNEYGTQFRKAGLDGSSAIGLINQALKAGARDGDIAADAIKEFSIRAVDGSESTADGFKALGLNADDMAAKFAKGGKSANGVLDLTLDKLRGVKDPVKQSQIAVQLFGTQAEDLGKALFAMDPSKATTGLGKFAGATDKAGKTIRSGPSHEIEVFTRRLQQGFVSFVGGTLLPVVSDIAHWLNDNLGPAVRGLGDGLAATGRWFREWGIWLAPLALLIGGVTLALNAQAIATGLVTGVMSVYSVLSKGITAVTKAWAATQAVLNAVMSLNPIALVVIALVALGAALFIAWKKSETFRAIVQAAWDGIKAAVSFAWNSIIKPAFAGLVAGLKSVGKFFTWLWTNAVKPAFGWIASGASTVWAGVKLIFGYFITGLKTVGGWFKWLWDKGVKPAFDGVRSIISTAWNSGIKPVFAKLREGTEQVGKAFDVARAAIKVAWDKIKGIAKAPVKFIIDTVYNGGIVKVWNAVASKFGAPTLSAIKGFATGGILPGYTPGRDVHLAALSGGEAVMRPEWTRAVGPGYVNTMNAAARSGGVSAIRRMVGGGLPAFADGGIFGWVKSAASKGVDLAKSGFDWLKDGIKASAVAGLNKIVRPLIEKISGSASAYRTMLTGVPKKMINAIVDFSGEADKKMEALGIGGGSFKSALSWARTQHGKRYQWGGNGNPSWDCSGFVSAIESVIRGQRPHRRWATGAFAGGNAPGGWKRNARSPYQIGITHAGVGHTAGTINGVNVESRGGDGVLVGSRARGYSSSLFTSRYGFVAKKYDEGGWLQPGITTVVNKTGQPEAVLTARQWETVAAGSRAAASAPSTQYVINARTADFTVADLDRVQRVQEARARVGRPR